MRARSCVQLYGYSFIDLPILPCLRSPSFLSVMCTCIGNIVHAKEVSKKKCRHKFVFVCVMRQSYQTIVEPLQTCQNLLAEVSSYLPEELQGLDIIVFLVHILVLVAQLLRQ